MQIRELFARIDEVMANDWSKELKLAWLNDIERQVIEEVFDTHEMSTEESLRASDFKGYTAETPQDTVLLVQDPHSVLYQYYMEAQIARANGDKQQQQDATTLFDNAYLTYRRYVNRTRKPTNTMQSFLI
mgnify:CR=1 FL=1